MSNAPLYTCNRCCMNLYDVTRDTVCRDCRAEIDAEAERIEAEHAAYREDADRQRRSFIWTTGWIDGHKVVIMQNNRMDTLTTTQTRRYDLRHISEASHRRLHAALNSNVTKRSFTLYPDFGIGFWFSRPSIGQQKQSRKPVEIPF